MTSISTELDDWIRAEIHKLTLDRRPLSDVLVDIDTLERRIREAMGGDGHTADLLSARRTLARLRLARALELSADAPLARDLFEQSVALGFEASDDRVVAAALFSRICLARGRLDLLNGELESALGQIGVESDPGYQKLVDKIRRVRRND